LGGTPRPGSSSECALRIALAAAAERGAETVLFSGRELNLPLYDPTQAERSEGARRLLSLLAKSDGIIVSSPGYHGSISGLVKNALDYIEDLRMDVRTYLDGRAVGCIVCAQGWQAAGTTLVALRSIVHSLRAWPTPLGVTVNSAVTAFAKDGSCLDVNVVTQLQIVGRQVVEFALRGSQPAARRVDTGVTLSGSWPVPSRFPVPRFCAICGGQLVHRHHREDATERLTCCSCHRVTYNSPSLLVSAYIFAEDSLLLIRRGLAPYEGKWAPPTGFVEAGESLDAAISREVFEEVGLSIPNDRYVPIGIISLPAINQAYVSFLLRLERRVAIRAASPEVLEAEWFLERHYPAGEIWDPELGRDVSWLFEMAHTGRLEFFQQTELKMRRLNGECAAPVGLYDGQWRE
jgi:FMN reductase